MCLLSSDLVSSYIHSRYIQLYSPQSSQYETEVRLHGTNIEDSPDYVEKKCPKESDAETIGENLK